MNPEVEKPSSNYIYGPSALKQVQPKNIVILVIFLLGLCVGGRALALRLFDGATKMVASVKATASATWVERAHQSIHLDARKEWSYDLELAAGERVDFQVVGGRWSVGRWGENVNLLTDGSGILDATQSTQNLPVSTAPPGALIGKFEDQQPFFIGNQSTFIAPTNGLLSLGINDLDLGDNQGSLEIELTLYRMQ
jgi:hypothetical protein